MTTGSTTNVCRVLKKEPRGRAQVIDPAAAEKDSNEERENQKLYCAACSHPITSKDQRIEVSGSHDHTFANPSGYVFRIGCFRGARGSITERESTSIFTWFPGYAWSMSVCSLCGNHLGWHYRSQNNAFFGFVLDRLIEKDTF